MRFSNYKIAKSKLRAYAEWVKIFYNNDKPAIREAINIKTHEQASEWRLTEHKANLLHNYACKLHPKDKPQKRSESYHASLLYGVDNQ